MNSALPTAELEADENNVCRGAGNPLSGIFLSAEALFPGEICRRNGTPRRIVFWLWRGGNNDYVRSVSFAALIVFAVYFV